MEEANNTLDAVDVEDTVSTLQKDIVQHVVLDEARGLEGIVGKQKSK